MANPEHLEILKQGVETWNQWSQDNFHVIPDFSEADLSGADLFEADFGRANLSGAILREADLGRVNLRGAILRNANLDEANLSSANLSGADLGEASLYDANLIWANLVRANLIGANLFVANLACADLSEADLSGANLRGAILGSVNLSKANLSGANLNATRLLFTILNGATLTGAHLWATQRTGWSIKGVICEHVYWEENGKDKRYYRPGEFERLFADKTKVRLFYKDGINPLEIATIPALIKHLEESHLGSSLRLVNIHEDSGGVVVELAIEAGGNQSPEQLGQLKAALETEAMQKAEFIRQALSEREAKLQLQGEVKQLTSFVDKLIARGSIIMGDTYKVSGQAGAVGQNAHANDMTFNQANQFEQTSDLPALATSLEELQQDFEYLSQGRKYKMKLSKEAKDRVEAQFSIYLDTTQKILDTQLKEAYREVSFKSQAHERRTQLKIDYIEGLIKTKTSLYIQAYKTDRKIIDEAERDEIMKEFESLVQSHSNIGTEYTNVFSGLSPDQAKAYEDELIVGYKGALNIARKALDDAVAEMLLQEKEKIAKKSTPAGGFISDPKIPT
jgi:Pentapeptide repeats (8 copies)